MGVFEGFEPVFGSAQGTLEPPATRDLLPFLFCLRAKDSDRLEIHVTDFHANTWYADMSTEFLEDLNEDIGIAGNFDNFVSYVRAAFASDNVRIDLSGSPNEGATSATVVGQRDKGYPIIRVKLSKVEGTAASDAMGTISVGMFKLYRSQAESLSQEASRAQQMTTGYTQEKVRADMLQDKLDALNYNKKKKRPVPTPSFDDLSEQLAILTAQLPYEMQPMTVFEDDLVPPRGKAAASSGPAELPKPKPAAKPGFSGPPRLRAAPLVRKPKRRPTTVDSD